MSIGVYSHTYVQNNALFIIPHVTILMFDNLGHNGKPPEQRAAPLLRQGM